MSMSLRKALLGGAAALTLTLGPAAADELPLSRVILSTAGLAHFEHIGEVGPGDVTLELPVRLDQVDDLLKSLVVFDPSGRIAGVTVPGRQPLEEAFRDLPFNREDLNNPVALLNALQGAEIEITGAVEATGLLVRVTPRQRMEDGATVTTHEVTLLTEQGLRIVDLDTLDSLQFVEEDVQEQIARGLHALFENRVADQRTLNVDLVGDQARQVAMAYVVSAPLWKAAYRLVLPQDPEAPALIQGWAVFENRTGSDWEDVEITLVSGNPVTFRQNLYESYYVSRPVLPVEVLGRVTPRVDTGNMDMDAVRGAEEIHMGVGMMDGLDDGYARNRGAYGGAFAAESAGMPMPSVLAPMALGDMTTGRAEYQAQLVSGAQAATSEDATTQVLFTFPGTFDVASGESVMMPFITSSLPVERVALYQPDTHPTHPLSAIRLDNDSGAGLPPGILTLYDAVDGGTAFVGDAQVPVIPDGDYRYISYALDNRTSIDRESQSTQQLVSATIVDGVLRSRVRRRQTTSYTIEAPANEGRTVLLEHPRSAGWDLVMEDLDENSITRTDTHYRIKVEVEAGETVVVPVSIERTDAEVLALVGQSVSQLTALATRMGSVSDELRRTFEQLAERRSALEGIRIQVQELQRQRNVLFQDQQRVRENFRAIPSNSDLARRYLSQLESQEDQIQDLDQRVTQLTSEANSLERELNALIGELNL